MIDKGKYRKIQRPSAKISSEEVELAKRYLQGAVHSFCKNNPGQAFSVRDLAGGENKDWNGTPLQVLYNYHIAAGKTKEKAKKQAAIDAGWLLKTVLEEEENRLFEQMQGPRSKLYRKID
ncbi:MAG: hypothetical protein IKJ94_02295 [Oscillospiraceae bacterium]|nr:hypothetical protein [Oscillospiraceae bacterium]